MVFATNRWVPRGGGSPESMVVFHWPGLLSRPRSAVFGPQRHRKPGHVAGDHVIERRDTLAYIRQAAAQGPSEDDFTPLYREFETLVAGRAAKGQVVYWPRISYPRNRRCRHSGSPALRNASRRRSRYAWSLYFSRFLNDANENFGSILSNSAAWLCASSFRPSHM